MAATSTTDYGAAGKLSGPVEYSCARRLRHSLLHSSLSQQGLDPTFKSMVRQTDAPLRPEHLRRLVAGGLWGEALDYLRRFLPPGAGDDIEAHPVLLFLHALWAFVNIAASASAGHATVALGTHLHDFNVCLSISRSDKLRTILNFILRSPQFRASLNWGVIRNKAASTACNLASSELSRLQLPSDMATTRASSAFASPRRIRYVKQLPGRVPAHVITKLYLNKRRSLPSSSPQPGVEDRSLNQVADLIKECFKAGVSLKLFRSSAPSGILSATDTDAPGAPFFNTKISSLTDAAKNIGTSLLPNAGAPVSCPAKTSGILSATDTGTVNTPQGIITRKHPRTEVSAVQEEPDLKRQRTCIRLATDLLLTV